MVADGVHACAPEDHFASEWFKFSTALKWDASHCTTMYQHNRQVQIHCMSNHVAEYWNVQPWRTDLADCPSACLLFFSRTDPLWVVHTFLTFKGVLWSTSCRPACLTIADHGCAMIPRWRGATSRVVKCVCTNPPTDDCDCRPRGAHAWLAFNMGWGWARSQSVAECAPDSAPHNWGRSQEWRMIKRKVQCHNGIYS